MEPLFNKSSAIAEMGDRLATIHRYIEDRQTDRTTVR